MKPTATLVLAALSAIAWGCDEGRIYDDYEFEGPEGLAARVTATVTGADQWPEGYALAVAGFADGSEYALISKNAEAGPDGSCDVVLTGIPREVTSVELCAIDRLRRRVGTFAKAECSEKADTIRLAAGNVDASPAAAIQAEIFNTTCTQCHGGADFAAARLDLTSGNAFAELIGVESVKEPGRMRVEPGHSSSSVLYRILSTDESAGWNYDHSVEVVASEKLDLIKNWIDAGAKY